MKIKGMFLTAILALVAAFGPLACSEYGAAGSTGVGIGKGHNGTVMEVTVILDGAGFPKKVQFDEIFNVDYAGEMSEATYNGYSEAVRAQAAVKLGTKYYYKVLVLDDNYFDIVTDDGKFVGYSGKAGGKEVANLFDYAKTEGEGLEWYYDCVARGKAFYGTKVSDTEYGFILNSRNAKIPFTTTYQSIRKRYSTYWSANIAGLGLGWRGNVERMENYLLTHGFEGLDTSVNSTGATATDTPNYMEAALRAYNNAKGR
ncbi:MAG: hypothetical protein LBP26_05880 [Clostridiales bacterium]|jgi:hypothetical protein|nr:hypothetical protein [Clostridiales bacterium]